MDYAALAKKIVKDKLNADIITIKENTKGADNVVFIVNDKYVVRLLRVPWYTDEVWAIEQCIKLGLPVPEVLAHGIEDGVFYILESKLVGEDAKDVTLKKEQWQAIYYELGKIAKKIHSITADGFGHIKFSHKGELNTFREFMLDWYEETGAKLTYDVLPKEILDKARKLFMDNLNLTDIKQGVLLHGDFRKGNYIVKDGKLVGMIDFADACIGDPMFELGMIAENIYPDGMDSFLKGYGKCDKKKMYYYAMFNALALVYDFGMEHPEWSREGFERVKASLKHFMQKV